MKFRRSSGIILHITSLPGPHGVGSLGREAYQFVDWLAEARQRFWEVLPINPLGYGNSPYASPSAFAGSPLLISLEKLVETGYLAPDDLPPAGTFSTGRVDFPRAIRIKKKAIKKAFRRFRQKANNPHLPERYPDNCAAYTGTHDTDTTCGWFGSLAEKEKEAVLSYFGTDHEEINWKFIQRILSSVADLAVTPIQDVLGLGSEARMNTPGRGGGQWEWRCAPDVLTRELATRLAQMTRYYGR